MPGKSLAQQLEEEAEASEGRDSVSQYQPGFATRATDYCLLGATNAELATFFGVYERTINKWLVEIPRFAKAVQAGREQADAKVAKALFHRARGYSHKAQKIFNNGGDPLVVDYVERYPPDTNAAALWLSNRQRGKWRSSTAGDAQANAFDLGAFVGALGAAAQAIRGQPGDGAKVIDAQPVKDDATSQTQGIVGEPSVTEAGERRR